MEERSPITRAEPRRVISATSAARAAVRACTTTSCPSSRSCFAAAFPSPVVEPVMSTRARPSAGIEKLERDLAVQGREVLGWAVGPAEEHQPFGVPDLGPELSPACAVHQIVSSVLMARRSSMAR